MVMPSSCSSMGLKGSLVGSSVPKAKLQKTKKGIARRPIDQLGYIEDTNTLVVLSGESILSRP